MKYQSACKSLRQKQLNNLTAKIKDTKPFPEKQDKISCPNCDHWEAVMIGDYCPDCGKKFQIHNI